MVVVIIDTFYRISLMVDECMYALLLCFHPCLQLAATGSLQGVPELRGLRCREGIAQALSYSLAKPSQMSTAPHKSI